MLFLKYSLTPPPFLFIQAFQWFNFNELRNLCRLYVDCHFYCWIFFFMLCKMSDFFFIWVSNVVMIFFYVRCQLYCFDLFLGNANILHFYVECMHNFLWCFLCDVHNFDSTDLLFEVFYVMCRVLVEVFFFMWYEEFWSFSFYAESWSILLAACGCYVAVFGLLLVVVAVVGLILINSAIWFFF